MGLFFSGNEDSDCTGRAISSVSPLYKVLRGTLSESEPFAAFGTASAITGNVTTNNVGPSLTTIDEEIVCPGRWPGGRADNTDQERDKLNYQISSRTAHHLSQHDKTQTSTLSFSQLTPLYHVPYKPFPCSVITCVYNIDRQ